MSLPRPSRTAVLWTVAVVTLFALLLLRPRQDAGSTLSFGGSGWRGLAAVLESEGLEVSQLGTWPSSLADPETEQTFDTASLMMSFPWQGAMVGDLTPVRTFVSEGGTLVLGYSNAPADLPLMLALDTFGLDFQPISSSPSLLPWRWFTEQSSQEHQLSLSEQDEPRQPLMTARLPFVVDIPTATDPKVLASTDSGHAVAWSMRFGTGQLILLPTSSLSNAYLHNPGNAALLLNLLPDLGPSVAFDEVHHGFATSTSPQALRTKGYLDRVVLQLLALYALALLAFGWRFGPRWPAQVPAFDSHRAFLIGLGSLHERLGHQKQAATLLIQRLAAYVPHRYPPETVQELNKLAETQGLLEVARQASNHDTPSNSGPKTS